MSHAVNIHNPQAVVRPAFTVTKIDDVVTRIVRTYVPRSKLASMDKKELAKLDRTTKFSGGFINTEVTEPGGYLVTIPTKKNSSFRIRDLEELHDFGFDVQPAMINIDTMEVVAQGAA